MVSETDIANRALQYCGTSSITQGNTLWNDDTKGAAELQRCYHIVRRAEQRRNVWRTCIRTTALRAIDNDSKLVAFGAWAIGTTYGVNDVVTGSDGNVYFSTVGNNVGHDPTDHTYQYWTNYFGPVMALEFVTTWDGTLTYAKGDHSVGSDGQVYISLVDANTNHNPVGDGNVHWSVTTDGVLATALSFYAGELVFQGNKVYLSKINANQDVPTVTASWLSLTTPATVSLFNFIYPIGTGPRSNNATKNAYRLPYGFLREAPQDPKAGSVLFLGAPSALPYNDWNVEGNFFTTRDSGVITYRFVFDLADPTQMDPLFVEGFAARLALSVVQPITQSGEKLDEIGKAYNTHMGDARLVNGIETGATQPPEDDYVSCRL